MIGPSRLTPADHDRTCTFRGTGRFDPPRCHRCTLLAQLVVLRRSRPTLKVGTS